MAIPDFAKRNFSTLLRAAEAGHLVLMECQDAKTGEPRYVVCASQRVEGGAEDAVTFTPFGHLHTDGNPYEAYIPPEV